MGKHLNRRTPKTMPTAAAVGEANAGLAKHFTVTGCRGADARANETPRVEVHGVPTVVGEAPDALRARLQGREVYVFVHGYNVTSSEALRSARDFFGKLHAAFERDGRDTTPIEYVLFTWPGDTGTLHFNDAQAYAQHAGVALFALLFGLQASHLAVVTHSLGAHVALRAAAILGERLFHGRPATRMDRLLLLGASVEDDVFERPKRHEEYHFPEAAFGVRRLHISASRADDVLSGPFRVNEADAALGESGPESMSPLVSLASRVRAVTQNAEDFQFELHDLSPHSATIMNPELFVHSHGGYWARPAQLDYYVGRLR
jgi:esterase/lipase superfamily enzyme